jgi:uncharacterized PurR-regulated membrane protein YhhQ (DUF165 family)
MINIVLPVDFGDKTEQLLEGAVKFAKQVNGRIYLIHVAPLISALLSEIWDFSIFRKWKKTKSEELFS